MKRKLLGIFLCFCMTFTLLPVTVFAADTPDVAIRASSTGMGTETDGGVIDGTYYLVNTDGTLETDGANQNSFNIYYEKSSNTLTINNLKIGADDKWLLVPGGTTINVLGENRIEPPAGGSYGGGIAATKDGDITITGSGSLYIKSSTKAGISYGSIENKYSGASAKGSILIGGDVKLTVDHFGASSCISPNQGDVTFFGNAQVTLDPRAGNDKDNSSITSFSGANVTIKDSANITTTGGFDTTGKNTADKYGKITVNGSGTLTITDTCESGVSLRGYGGIEVTEGAKLIVSSNTKSGQAVVASQGAINIAGEAEVNMTNTASAGNTALYAQNIEITGKLVINGGINGLYLNSGNIIAFNGADVKVLNCMIGATAKTQITNSLVEMNTTLKAFNSTTNAVLTDDYTVFSGTSSDKAVLVPHENGVVAAGTWEKAYVRVDYAAKISVDKASVSFGSSIEGSSETPATQTVTITNTGKSKIENLSVELTGTDAASFQLDTSHMTDNIVISGDTSFTVQPVTGLKAGKYQAEILVNCGGEELLRIPLSLEVIPAKPEANFTADGDNSGTLSDVSAGMKYSVDGGKNWKIVGNTTERITGVNPKDGIQIYQPGNDTADSEVQIINVTQAKQPEGVNGIACTTTEQNDGQIIGVDPAMEYRNSGDKNWTPVTGNSISGLANEKYEVRVKAVNSMLASSAITVTVEAHVCTASGNWRQNQTNHWKLCVCGEKAGIAAHSFEWVIDKEATTAEKGSKHEECTVCGYTKAPVDIPATGSTTDPENPSESETSKGETDLPKTGDYGNMVLLLIAIHVVSGMGLTSTLIYRKTKKR